VHRRCRWDPLVTIEAGKIVSEGQGEVQEMIDICMYACGLSRQLAGLTITSERPRHRMMETWHPLGVVGVISAFNFPVAVWAWYAALAFVCGDSFGLRISVPASSDCRTFRCLRLRMQRDTEYRSRYRNHSAGTRNSGHSNPCCM
jgi:acyl-CoA reductase-like NAD-dependent aldehyde dehydrogenase